MYWEELTIQYISTLYLYLQTNKLNNYTKYEIWCHMVYNVIGVTFLTTFLMNKFTRLSSMNDLLTDLCLLSNIGWFLLLPPPPCLCMQHHHSPLQPGQSSQVDEA